MATIKQIAQQAGVAPSTVSRVLNHDASLSVSHETREAILSIAKQLNYKSPRQRRQETQDSESIAARTHFKVWGNTSLNAAVVHFLNPSEELNDPFYTSIRIGIENCCHKYNIALRNTFRSHISANQAFIREAQAVICVGHFTASDAELLYSLNNKLIFVDSNPLGNRCDSVEFDREQAAQEIVSHILLSGAKRPAFIGNNETRLHVFRHMTKAFNLYDEKRCIVSKNFCIDSGYQAMNQILSQTPLPDVVFASTDIIAIGVYRAIQERELSIPQDIQVVGMNDNPTSQHLKPSLSTMRLYPTEMGEAAIDLFLELVSGRQYRKHVRVGYEFIWRESFTTPDAPINRANKT